MISVLLMEIWLQCPLSSCLFSTILETSIMDGSRLKTKCTHCSACCHSSRFAQFYGCQVFILSSGKSIPCTFCSASACLLPPWQETWIWSHAPKWSTIQFTLTRSCLSPSCTAIIIGFFNHISSPTCILRWSSREPLLTSCSCVIWSISSATTLRSHSSKWNKVGKSQNDKIIEYIRL